MDGGKMNVLYRPKHMKPHDNYISFINACHFVVDETVWYAKWWGRALRQIANKFYQFGELILVYSIIFIDKIDQFLEH
jgi:hypothetical protein